MVFASDDAAALLSVEESYRCDKAAEAAGVAGITLMEAAGASIAESIRARWQPCETLIACGPGNNGGDGFVVARHLAEAGWPVRLGLLGARERLKGDAAHHAGRWNGPVHPLSVDLLDDCALFVDSLFGAGLSRPLEGVAREVIEAARERDLPSVAVDVPSGIGGDSGQTLGAAVLPAALTVTFFRKKTGQLLLPGRQLCGEVVATDIGIPESVLADIAPRCWENEPRLWRGLLPRRGPGDHKYRFGHLLVAGGMPMTGAGRLASRAALRVGAGLVTVACPREAFTVYALSAASVIVEPLAAPEDYDRLLEDSRKNALLLGPGNGVQPETKRRVLAALGTGRAMLLDADALTVFQDRPGALFDAIAGPTVLTPHDGEFARLFPDLTEGDKLSRTRAAAARAGAVVLLKGADTVIAAPDGRAVINANAPPALATAGAGDVLAGLIAGLLAQRMDPFSASAVGAWLHGAAASAHGPGLIAEDLPDRLPAVLDVLI
ncbi:MAG: NAD(P)H-hydrate dehydratase [Pseudomonadota bacterium]